MNIQTILVPTDFSKDADHALSTAIDLAGVFEANIVVMHAYHIDLALASPVVGAGTLPQEYYDDLRARAAAEVERAAESVRAQGIEATSIAVAGPASTAILEQAEIIPASLIVIGTRGLSGLKHVMLGSVAERVLRMAPCPVMTVKARSD